MKSQLLLAGILAFLCLNSQAQNTCTPAITSGLFAYLPFCGTANDVSGNLNNGTTYSVTLTSDRFGNASSAYAFNGLTSYIDLGTTTTLNFPSGVSFCAWVMPSAFANSSVVDDMTGSGNGFRINVRDNSSPSPLFYAHTGSYGGGISAASTSQYSLNNWFFMVGTWGTDDSVRVYFNGQKQQTVHSTYNYSNSLPIYIGRGRLSSVYEFFNGKIDDISIYNRVLTSGEINTLYNPISNCNTWTQKSNFGGVARNAATFVSVGSKGYLGLGADGGSPATEYNDWWSYNPANDSWTQKASFTGSGRHGASAFSIGGKAYVGTGHDGSNYVKDFFAYDTLSNSWAPIAGYGGNAVGYSVAFTISGYGYVGTGYNNPSTYRRDFWRYDPAADSWAQKADFGGSAREGAAGFSIGTKGYMGAGEDGTYKNDLWQYNASLDSWSQKSSFAGAGRFFPAGFSISGKGYFCLGTVSQWAYATDCYEYNPSSDSWTQTASFPGLGRYQVVGGAIGNKGYIGTGWDVNTSTNYKDFWQFGSVLPTVTISGNTTICSGDVSTLTASGATSYVWNTNATTTSISASPTAAVSYTVTGTNAGGCSNSNSISVVVNPAPATPTINVNMSTLASSSGAGNQWYLNGNPISAATAQTYTVTQNGLYTVCVTDANGCSSCSAPYNFTSTGISELQSIQEVIIAPNPVNDDLWIEFNLLNEEDVNFRVINSLGQKVRSANWGHMRSGEHEMRVRLENLPDGLYNLSISTQAYFYSTTIIKE